MNQQNGFTLIELIIVMAILAAMAATAFPRYNDIMADARHAKMMALVSSMKVSAAMTHGSSQAEQLLQNSPLSMEDGTIVAMRNFYPDATTDGIGNSFDGAGYASSVTSGVSITFFPDAVHAIDGKCEVTYYPAFYRQAIPASNTPYIDDSGISNVVVCE